MALTSTIPSPTSSPPTTRCKMSFRAGFISAVHALRRQLAGAGASVGGATGLGALLDAPVVLAGCGVVAVV